MNTRTSVSFVLCAAMVAALAACGGGSSPSTPSTPTPTAQPTPTPTPTPGNTLPPGMTCSSPTPPPLYGMYVKIHDDSSKSRIILDSKPLVMNVDGYCGKVGAGETVRFCETRLEGNSERAACDYLATGKSAATGRWGPTWYWNGKPCDGENFTSCANHQENQFMAIAKTSGLYEACASPDVPIHPEGQACGGKNLK